MRFRFVACGKVGERPDKAAVANRALSFPSPLEPAPAKAGAGRTGDDAVDVMGRLLSR